MTTHARGRWLTLLTLCACTSELATDRDRDLDDPTEDSAISLVGDPATLERVILEVDHQPDAAPYTGNAGPAMGDTWDIFHNNAAALFDLWDVEVEAPRTLAEMGALPASDDEDYTVDELLALSADHLDATPDATDKVVHVLWVDGMLQRASGSDGNVLGVSIGNTGVIAMFKPVVERLGLIEATRRLAEQAVLVHEFGHAAGLVSNGLPVVADHHDSEHGAHCTNRDCVMYWTHEGSDVLDFVGRRLTGRQEVLFDQDCLDDMAAGKED